MSKSSWFVEQYDCECGAIMKNTSTHCIEEHLKGKRHRGKLNGLATREERRAERVRKGLKVVLSVAERAVLAATAAERAAEAAAAEAAAADAAAAEAAAAETATERAAETAAESSSVSVTCSTAEAFSLAQYGMDPGIEAEPLCAVLDGHVQKRKAQAEAGEEEPGVPPPKKAATGHWHRFQKWKKKPHHGPRPSGPV
uniref:Uncharacterized protein n=1 Tax=Eutreptiella gymnastica TaxID=73025 RepID=A0A7S1HYG8_9EUGL